MRYARCALTLAAFFVLGLLAGPAAAQPTKPVVQTGAAQYERLSTAAFFYARTATSFDVYGQFELTYGSPGWKPEFQTALDNAKPGTRLRLGNNFWTVFDTSCPVDLGKATLPPGTYYLALEMTAEDELSLVFLDPVPIRAAKKNANDTAETRGGPALRLAWKESAEVAENLAVKLQAAKPGPPRATLEVRFGPHVLSADLVPVFATGGKE